jgi:uncharacterized membrane protein YhdT
MTNTKGTLSHVEVAISNIATGTFYFLGDFKYKKIAKQFFVHEILRISLYRHRHFFLFSDFNYTKIVIFGPPKFFEFRCIATGTLSFWMFKIRYVFAHIFLENTQRCVCNID